MRLLVLLFLALPGCASHAIYNIIDITDEQHLEDAHGNLCQEKQMIITVDSIVYYYPDCGVTRVVKPKPHILPKPSPKPTCTDNICNP